LAEVLKFLYNFQDLLLTMNKVAIEKRFPNQVPVASFLVIMNWAFF